MIQSEDEDLFGGEEEMKGSIAIGCVLWCR